MQIGLVTDGLADLRLDMLLPTVAGLGITMVEFACGNWSSAPHLDLDFMLAPETARADFLSQLAAHGLTISALNCSGNPLHPGAKGQAHRAVTGKTIRLAGLLGVKRVVMMSGCPGGPGDANANWVTTAWPPEAAQVLAWQWSEQVIPYWHGLVKEAQAHSVERICLERMGSRTSTTLPPCFACAMPSALSWAPTSTPAICSGWGPIRLSIEHEDLSLPPLDGVRESVNLLQQAIGTSNRPSAPPRNASGVP